MYSSICARVIHNFSKFIMITFDHYICAFEHKLTWKQIRTRKKEHQKELIVLKERKSCRENKGQ